MRRLYRLFRIGGKEIPVYYKFDPQQGQDVPQYPDFRKAPVYTPEGRPLTLAVYEGCPYERSPVAGEAPAGDCGSCAFYHQEETPLDLMGVCMNGALCKKETEEGK